MTIEYTNNLGAGFTQVPNEIVNSPRLSSRAKGLYVYLASKPTGWKFNSERIARDFKDGRDSIRAGLRELESVGLIKRTTYNNEHGQFVTRYEIMGQMTEDGNTGAGEAVAGQTVAGEPDAGPTVAGEAVALVIKNKEIKNKAIKSKEIKSNTLTEQQLGGEFELLWQKYPNKKGKPAAFKSYSKARKAGTSKKRIEDGIDAYRAYIETRHIEPRYIKHGSTWFNQQCWTDEYETDRLDEDEQKINSMANPFLRAALRKKLEERRNNE